MIQSQFKNKSTDICIYTVKACNLKFYLGYTDMEDAGDNVTTLLLSHKNTFNYCHYHTHTHTHTQRQWLYKLKISAKTCKMCRVNKKFQLLVTKCIFTSTAQKSPRDFFQKRKLVLIWFGMKLEFWELRCLCLSQPQNKRLLNFFNYYRPILKDDSVLLYNLREYA